MSEFLNCSFLGAAEKMVECGFKINRISVTSEIYQLLLEIETERPIEFRYEQSVHDLIADLKVRDVFFLYEEGRIAIYDIFEALLDYTKEQSLKDQLRRIRKKILVEKIKIEEEKAKVIYIKLK